MIDKLGLSPATRHANYRTVGILDKAARMGLIDLRDVLKDLQETNFYIAKGSDRKIN